MPHATSSPDRIASAGTLNRPLGVSLVSGFLGSGKTTLINRLLSADHGVRMGVIVNDFGAIDIDSRLIVSQQEDTVTLANGCICCTLKDDVGVALQALRDREVEHVVVEASGIADPRVLASTFVALDQGRRVALDAVIVVVDSDQLTHYGYADQSLARDQLSQANVVLLNKIDLADPPSLAAAAQECERFAPRAAVVRCEYANVPVPVLLGVGRFTPDQLCDPVERAPDAHGFRSMSFRCDEPLALSRLREVATELPKGVFRAKGFVYLREQPDHACVLQVVGRRARIDRGALWGDQPRRTELVFLGRGYMDERELTRAFEACAVPPSQPTKMDRAMAWLRDRWS